MLGTIDAATARVTIVSLVSPVSHFNWASSDMHSLHVLMWSLQVGCGISTEQCIRGMGDGVECKMQHISWRTTGPVIF